MSQAHFRTAALALEAVVDGNDAKAVRTRWQKPLQSLLRLNGALVSDEDRRGSAVASNDPRKLEGALLIGRVDYERVVTRITEQRLTRASGLADSGFSLHSQNRCDPPTEVHMLADRPGGVVPSRDRNVFRRQTGNLLAPTFRDC